MLRILKSSICRNIFLFDGIGALVSALILGIVLPYFEIGIPKAILIALSLIASVLGIFSLSCFFSKVTGNTWLRIIIAANTLYCGVTGIIVWSFYGDLAWFAITYFLVEIMLIMLLVWLELVVLRQNIR